jgi:hypothetical protein
MRKYGDVVDERTAGVLCWVFESLLWRVVAMS